MIQEKKRRRKRKIQKSIRDIRKKEKGLEIKKERMMRQIGREKLKRL